MPFAPICAKVNNRISSLDYKVFSTKEIEFLDLTSPSGQRTYLRTLIFILTKAVNDLFPEKKVTVCNAVSNGFFCYIKDDKKDRTPLIDQDIERIKSRVSEIIAADMKIKQHAMRTEKAIKIFKEQDMDSKVKLLNFTGRMFSTVYEIDGYYNYFYGSVLPRTSMVTLYAIDKSYDGLLLRIPSRKNPAELPPIIKDIKLHETFYESRLWQEIIGIQTIGDFNTAVEEGLSTDVIIVSEALQEKKIAKIAETIAAQKDTKIVLIAGPSSSGKTSTCKRVSIQLLTCGKKPLQISLDDYFVDRERTPLQPNGDYDYESIYALNLELFNRNLNELLEGKAVRLPRYNFIKGASEMSDTILQMNEDNVLVIEGLHALNPMLTQQIDDKHIFRLYASALTSISLDEHNYIPTSDNRLLRRIIRDARTRGCDARETIRRWPSVREGEDKWIFPYQDNADAVLNTAMLFELAVIKNHVEPVLERVPENCPEYSEAYRLLKFLKYIPKVPEMDIPGTSLLREFLGGSSFNY